MYPRAAVPGRAVQIRLKSHGGAPSKVQLPQLADSTIFGAQETAVLILFYPRCVLCVRTFVGCFPFCNDSTNESGHVKICRLLLDQRNDTMEWHVCAKVLLEYYAERDELRLQTNQR